MSYKNVNYIYDQKITWAEIPVVVKYYFNLKFARPYVEGGINGRLSLNSMEKSGTFGRYWLTNSSTSDKILTTFLSDIENFGILLGGGVCRDFNKFSLRLGIRYDYNIKNSASSSKFSDVNSYSEIPETEEFHYTDDINMVSFRNLQVSVGLVYNLSYKVF